ncbi:helix-turn-helix transcriptional regulator [Microbaculum sp. FT89]|uniref:helix-turn-helix transcriptional regulator n=1 Tax=Microbaculum sp. FT89 TaxID=3447298 RepID=UPI003F52F40C
MNGSKLPSDRGDVHGLDDILDREGAADLLGVSARTLDRWHALRIGPPRIRMGSQLVRYRRSSILEWLSDQEVAGPRLVENPTARGR